MKNTATVTAQTVEAQWIGRMDLPSALESSHTQVRVVDRRDLDAVVDELRQLTQVATLDLALAVGRLVIDRFYDGDTNAWRLRGRRCTSFRKLAARPDLPMSASALYRSVAIYELWQRLGGIVVWTHVGACHARAVLGLPPADQELLLRRAESESMTVRQLEEVAATLREQRNDRRGRPRRRPLQQATIVVRRSLDALADALAHAELDKAPPEDLGSLKDTLAQLRARCEQIDGRLRCLHAD
jgi:hypothetical protein